MSEVNAFMDAQRRLYDALRVMSLQRRPVDEYVVVMHPAKWKALLRECPIPLPFAEPTRLFGFDVHLDLHVDEDYLALRHEVRA